MHSAGACGCTKLQRPWPVQSPGQEGSSQASPPHPGAHWHMPAVQVPCWPQSATYNTGAALRAVGKTYRILWKTARNTFLATMTCTKRPGAESVSDTVAKPTKRSETIIALLEVS